jgi:cardiolipin synthase A/B
MFEFTFFHLLFIASEILVFLILLHMLYQRRTPESLTVWLLVLFLLPFIGVFLYLLIGTRKLSSRRDKLNIELNPIQEAFCEHKIDSLLRHNNIAGTTESNSFSLIPEAVDAYAEVIEALSQAKESIYISTYVFANDVTAQAISDLLAKKAQEGVAVYLLLDAMGSLPMYVWQRPLKQMRLSGVKVAFFQSGLLRPIKNRINLRNHRKMFIIDHTILLSGGMNISDEYMGKDPETKRWRDILFRSQGPVVYHYFEVFKSDWEYACGEIIALPSANGTSYGNTQIQVVPSGPDLQTDALYEALLQMIYNAENRIWIVTPYFVPDSAFMQALIIAKKRGLDVRLITPDESDHIIADLGRSAYMRELSESNIVIARYTGGMLHAKSILVDHSIAMIGSANIDYRSLFLNYELVSLCYSEDVMKDIEQWMEMLMLRSHNKTPEQGNLRLLLENIMKIFAPLL